MNNNSFCEAKKAKTANWHWTGPVYGCSSSAKYFGKMIKNKIPKKKKKKKWKKGRKLRK